MKCVHQIPITFLLFTHSRRLTALLYITIIYYKCSNHVHIKDCWSYTSISTNDQLARWQADELCSHDLWGWYQRNERKLLRPVVKRSNTQWTVHFCNDRGDKDENRGVSDRTGPFTDGKPIYHYHEIVGKLFTSACSTTGAPFAT